MLALTDPTVMFVFLLVTSFLFEPLRGSLNCVKSCCVVFLGPVIFYGSTLTCLTSSGTSGHPTGRRATSTDLTHVNRLKLYRTLNSTTDFSLSYPGSNFFVTGKLPFHSILFFYFSPPRPPSLSEGGNVTRKKILIAVGMDFGKKEVARLWALVTGRLLFLIL